MAQYVLRKNVFVMDSVKIVGNLSLIFLVKKTNQKLKQFDIVILYDS